MSDNVQTLLMQAQAVATPYTRRISKQLLYAALAVVLASLFALMLPNLAGIAQAVVSGIGSAFSWTANLVSTAGSLLWSVVVLVAKGISFAMQSLNGFFGVALTFTGMFVVNAWYRARCYVMQSAVDLALQANLPTDDGRKLVKGFLRTQRNANVTMMLVSIFGMLQFLIFVAIRPATNTADAFGLYGLLIAAWSAVCVCSVVLFALQNRLTSSGIAAYAMFRASGLPVDDFLAELKPTSALYDREKAVTQQLLTLGLLSRGSEAHENLVVNAREMARDGSFGKQNVSFSNRDLERSVLAGSARE